MSSTRGRAEQPTKGSISTTTPPPSGSISITTPPLEGSISSTVGVERVMFRTPPERASITISLSEGGRGEG